MSQAGYKMVFNPNAVVFHLNHPDSLRKYAKLKFWRGYWRMVVYKRYPEKMLKDSYTPQTLKLQILLSFAFIACIFFIWLKPDFIFYLSILILISFIFSTLPFLTLALNRNIKVAIFSPIFLYIRAISLGFGIIYGLIATKQQKNI
jgi:GT2 family glycosyltransferase